MNIIISVKENYLPNGDGANEMQSLFSLPECERVSDFYVFSKEGIEDKVYIVEALSTGEHKYENDRMRELKKKLDINGQDNFFIFHDKDIRNRFRDGDGSFHYDTAFCKKEYGLSEEYKPVPLTPGLRRTFTYWLFQHIKDDEVYQILTRSEQNFHSFINNLKGLIGI